MTKLANHNRTQTTRHYRCHDDTITFDFKNLTFPLNVYAHALLLQEGKADYLHYGLFQNDRTSLQSAQQHSTDLLLAKLPQPHCRILEVGVGLGKTFSLLRQRGYDVHGITPDIQQLKYIQKSLGPEASVSHHSLEAFTAELGSFDAVLFQESAQYIEPLIIFNKALDLLPLAGDLLIIDEFALKHDKTGTGNLHLLNDMVTLSERFGFELVEHIDLSAMAAPTLDYLLQVTTIHRQRLINDLTLDNEQLTELDESNRTYRKKYASGHYGYALLHFRKKTIPKWRLRILEESQTLELFNLFKKTFHHDMSPAIWQWKYRSNSSHEIGVWQENQLIAHYGGISRKILFFGQPQSAVQIGDVMVDATVRGMLTRRGPFFLMAATFPECFVGYGKPYLIGFGFPNERAMRVAERLGLYTEVGFMVEYSWEPLSKFPLFNTRLCLIDHNRIEFEKAAIDKCWQHMAEDLQEAIVGVRDWKYLQHRYLTHPHQQYLIALVRNRFSSGARGILVLRFDPEGCEIVDLIAPLAEIPLLVTHARRLASIHGATRVFCQITDNFSSHFAVTGGTHKSANIRIPATAWSNGPTPETLKNHWWLMSGDKDFR